MAIVTSQVRIANRALIFLGTVERISSFQDGSALAEQIRDLWHETRRELINLHPWNFAIRRAILNRQGAPLFGWASRHQLPADILRWLPWSIGDENYFEGEEEDGYLLSNELGPVSIRYLRDVTDDTKWPPHFQMLMAYKLAADLAESATQIAGNVEEARVRYEGQDGRGGYLAEARRLDGLASGHRRNDGARISSRWLDGYGGSRRAPGVR